MVAQRSSPACGRVAEGVAGSDFAWVKSKTADRYRNGLPCLVVVERRGMLVREAAAKGSGETEDSGSEEGDG